MKNKIFSHHFAVTAGSLAFLMLAIISPLIVSAQAQVAPIGSSNAQDSNFQIVPCDAPPLQYTGTNGQQTSVNPVTGAATTPCDFNALITLVQRIINFLLYAAVFIAVLSIVYAGFIYLTAGGDTGKTKQAKEIFKVTFIGFAIALCSWLIVYTVINLVISPTFSAAYPNATNLLKQQ